MDNIVKKKVQISIPDKRMAQPICFNEKGSDRFLRLHQIENFKLKGKQFNFSSPNNISLFVNISKKELKASENIYKDLIQKKISSENIIQFSNTELKILYDYFEHLQISIIFSYSAVEAFVNACIPNSFSFEIINKKGVKEIWNKNNIERYFNTTEKIVKILPITVNVNKPENSYWDNFTKLEDIRNDIVHLKSSPPNKLDSPFLKKFFHRNIFDLIKSGYKIIQHYSTSNKAKFFIPFELVNNTFQVLVVDKIQPNFVVKENNNK